MEKKAKEKEAAAAGGSAGGGDKKEEEKAAPAKSKYPLDKDGNVDLSRMSLAEQLAYNRE